MKRLWLFLVRHRIPVMGIVFAVLAVALLIAILLLSSKRFDEQQRGLYITLVSAALGGLFTLIGVVITWAMNSQSEMKKTKEANVPEIFAPVNYDLAQATQINLWPDGQTQPIICNQRFYLKNSKKAAFRICGLRLSGGRNFYSESEPYIEPGELFCLAFDCEKEVGGFALSIKSVDDFIYDFEVKSQEGHISVNRK